MPISAIKSRRLDNEKEILKEDPRPGYIDDERDFGFEFAGYEITFFVKENNLTVTKIEKTSHIFSLKYMGGLFYLEQVIFSQNTGL